MESEVNYDAIRENYDLDRELEKVCSKLEERSKNFKEFPVLAEYLNHHLNLAGKRKRLIKMIAIANLCGGLDENIRHIIRALEMINSTIFLHDDIIDHDIERKGKPTLNKLIGYEKTLLVGNMLFALAMNELSQIECDKELKQKILEDFSYSIFVENIGQYSDLDFKNHFSSKMLEDWEKMVIRHSAKYVISALCSIARIKGRGDLVPFIENYETNCTLAGAAGDAIKGFLGKKKPRGDIKNMGFTILVNWVIQEKKKSKFDSSEELDESIINSKAIEKTKRYIEEKTRKSIEALNSIPNNFDKRVLCYLSEQNKEVT